MKLKTKLVSWTCILGVLLLLQCGVKEKDGENAGEVKEQTTEIPEQTEFHLSNNVFSVTIDAYGGAFSGINLKSNLINPLSWALTTEQMPINNKKGAAFKGHFLCLGRWGSPSKGEKEAGIPHNGEQSNTLWEISDQSNLKVDMSNDAPLDGLTVNRVVELSQNEASFLVKETFKNTFSLGRLSNVVQHVTLGPPFLNSEVLINTNAQRGFNQRLTNPSPYDFEFEWPMAYLNAEKETTDVRSTATPDNYCMTYIYSDKEDFGWVTAYDPVSGILLGYVWNLDEYPWINIWSHYEDGAPYAKGIEFGTTGIGRPYKLSLIHI